jgi:hypothetical protein
MVIERGTAGRGALSEPMAVRRMVKVAMSVAFKGDRFLRVQSGQK